MSSQLTSLTTVFDGQNWQLWPQSMQAFLMMNGLWAFVNGDLQEPVQPSPPAGPPAAVASTASQAENLTLGMGVGSNLEVLSAKVVLFALV